MDGVKSANGMRIPLWEAQQRKVSTMAREEFYLYPADPDLDHYILMIKFQVKMMEWI